MSEQHNGNNELQAGIFDLDGVLLDSSASVHFVSWRQLFEDVVNTGPFTHEDYDLHVSGLKRRVGLAKFLRARGQELGDDRLLQIAEDPEEIEKYAEIKQDLVLGLLNDPTFIIPRFEDTIRLVTDLRAAGIPTAIASSSENTPQALAKTGLTGLFDELAYGGSVMIEGERVELGSKPKPDVFLAAARLLGVDPKRAAGFEDAGDGVEAIRAAGMFSVAIERGGRTNQALRDAEADIRLTTFDGFTVDMLREAFRNRK